MARPDLPASTLARPDLDRRLDDAWRRRLTVVVAGPGYGKTTTLAAWAPTERVAWYTCDRRDASVAAFAGGLIEALSSALRVAAPDTARRLANLDTTSDAVGAALDRVAEVSNSLAGVSSDLLLVVDDVHFLERDGPANRFLEHLVLSAPRALHLVLASRESLAFPIDRLRGQGEASVVDAAMLALSVREVVALLQREIPDLPQALAEDLHRLTGGWPAAVRLAVDALEHAEDDPTAVLRGLERRDGPLFAYLAGEVFDRETPAVRELLGTVAPFERCTIELGVALGIEDADRILADLSSRGLLVQAIDQDGEFRVHDLIRSVSLARWKPEPDVVARVALAAGAWFENQGWRLDALRALERSGEPEALASFLERRGPELVAMGAAEPVVRAAERLPEPVVSRRLAQIVGEAHVVRGELEPARRAFGRAAAGLTELPASLAWRLGLLYHLQDDLGAALEVYERAMVDGSDPADEALLLGWKASAHWRRNDLTAARVAADAALELARSSENDSALACAHIAQAMLAASDGRRAAADAHAHAVFESAGRAGDVLQLVRMHSNRGTQLDEEGEYEAAIEAFDVAIRLARNAGYASFLATATANRGDAKRALGRLEEAAVDFRTARDAYESLGSLMASFPMAGLADVLQVRGDLTQARHLYAESLDLAERSGMVDRYHIARLAQVRSVDDPEEALRLARRAEEANGVWRARALVAAGWVELRVGNPEAARRLAQEVAVIAETTRDRHSLAEGIVLEAMASERPADHLDRMREAMDVFAALGCAIDEASVQLAIGRLGSGPAATATAARADRRLGRLGVATRPPLAAGLLAALPDPEAPAIEIRTLGGFGIIRHGEPVPGSAWQSRQARTLLKLLVTRRGRPMTRDALAEALWPGGDAATVSNRLSVALTTVRGVLDPDRALAADAFIDADAQSVAIRTDRLAIDVEVFLSAADAGHALRRRGDTDGARDALESAEQMYVGDFLEEDAYADWATGLREAARTAYVGVTRALAALALEAGDDEATIRHTLRLLERDPFEEEANLRLVAVLDKMGRHGEARHRFEGYVTRMREIDVEPAPYPAGLTA